MKRPSARSVSAIRDSWVVVATYTTRIPPGISASATASTHSHGASMSSTTRSNAGRGPRRDGPGAPGQVADLDGVQFGCGPPKNRSTLPRATSAKSARRSYDETRPVADRAQQRARQRPGADAGLDHARAGEDVGQPDDRGGVLRVDDRRPARHRQHEVAQQRAQHEVGHARVEVTTIPSGCPMRSSWSTRALVGVELLARRQRDGVHPPLGVGQLDQVARAERAAPVVGAGGGGVRGHGARG